MTIFLSVSFFSLMLFYRWKSRWRSGYLFCGFSLVNIINMTSWKKLCSFCTIFCIFFGHFLMSVPVFIYFSFYCVCIAFSQFLENANEIALGFTRCQPQCICALLRTFVVSVINIKKPYREKSVLIRTQYWWKIILMWSLSGCHVCVFCHCGIFFTSCQTKKNTLLGSKSQYSVCLLGACVVW